MTVDRGRIYYAVLMPGIIGRVVDAQRYYTGSDRGMPIINKFQFLALTSGSDLLFGFGSFASEEEAIREVVVAHREICKEDEPTINFARIKSVIRGGTAIRNIDMAKDYVPPKF